MTNFWENIFSKGPEGAAKMDFDQGVNLAIAASATSSLEHYIWATLPSANKSTGGELHVFHTDKKAEVDVYIREKLPDLAKKTTYLWHGFYATNIFCLPNLQPTILVSRSQPLWLFLEDYRYDSNLESLGNLRTARHRATMCRYHVVAGYGRSQPEHWLGSEGNPIPASSYTRPLHRRQDRHFTIR